MLSQADTRLSIFSVDSLVQPTPPGNSRKRKAQHTASSSSKRRTGISIPIVGLDVDQAQAILKLEHHLMVIAVFAKGLPLQHLPLVAPLSVQPDRDSDATINDISAILPNETIFQERWNLLRRASSDPGSDGDLSDEIESARMCAASSLMDVV
jgi:hypothetical protein